MFAREACPACGQGGASPVVDLPYDQPPISTYLHEFYREYPGCDFAPLAGQRFQLADCPHCGCIYQVQVPGEDFLGTFYGAGLYGSRPRGEASPSAYAVEQAVRELMMIVRFLSPATARPRVLDFGTGEGKWARLAAASGVETHVCDLSEHAYSGLEKCGVTCHPHSRLPLDCFDLINSEQVFEHLAHPAEEVRRIARSLRPGGILKIGVPLDPALRTKLRHPDWTAPKSSPASLNAVAPIEHLNHFEPGSLHALGRRAGLEPLEVRGWDLVDPRSPGKSAGLRQLAADALRRRLGASYRPHHRLTQTIFLRAAERLS